MRRLFLVILALLVTAAMAWALWPKPLDVKTATIDRRTITVTVEDEGQARVRDVFTVSAPVGGELQRIALRAGDDVIANHTVIASIRPVEPGLLDARSNRIALAAINAATAGVELARAEQRQAQAQLSYAQGETRRIAPLVRSGTVSDKVYDRAVVEELTAQTAVERARANITVQQGNLESARAALIHSGSSPSSPGEQGISCCVETRAPASGKILRVMTESQQVVQAGMPLAEIGDPADIEITVDLLSRDAVQVLPGAMAIIDGWGGPPLHAVVRKIDPAAVTKVSALGIEEQRVNVVLDLTDKPQAHTQLGHGFHVVAHITVWKGENLLAVPVSALFRAGSDWAVFVVADGRTHLRRIEIGQRDSEFSEIKGGLSEGEAVVQHPGDTVVDGGRVALLAN
jgi:HlyD family secretion protein